VAQRVASSALNPITAAEAAKASRKTKYCAMCLSLFQLRDAALHLQFSILLHTQY
jgi:hypothetical protein